MMSMAGMPMPTHAEHRRMKPEDAALHITVSLPSMSPSRRVMCFLLAQVASICFTSFIFTNENDRESLAKSVTIE